MTNMCMGLIRNYYVTFIYKLWRWWYIYRYEFFSLEFSVCWRRAWVFLRFRERLSTSFADGLRHLYWRNVSKKCSTLRIRGHSGPYIDKLSMMMMSFEEHCSWLRTFSSEVSILVCTSWILSSFLRTSCCNCKIIISCDCIISIIGR